MSAQRFLVFLFLLSVAPLVRAQTSPQQLDAMIQQGMEDWHIPGLAAIVVKDYRGLYPLVTYLNHAMSFAGNQ